MIHILEKFIATVEHYSNIEITIVATSAMRDAKNRQSVIKHIEECLGMQIEVISGAQEANYILKAIQGCMLWSNNDRMILVDLGGGSLEMSMLQGAQILFQKSFDWGVMRFSKLDLQSQQHFLKELAQQLREEVKEYFPLPVHLILTGGAAKIWARLIHSKKFPRQPIKNPFDISWKMFIQMKAIILENEPGYYVKLNQIRPDQAEVLIPSLLIFEQLGNLFQCECLRFPFVGLKEGILMQRVQQYVPDCGLLSANES